MVGSEEKVAKMMTPVAARAAMAVVMAAAVAGDLLWAVRAVTTAMAGGRGWRL